MAMSFLFGICQLMKFSFLPPTVTAKSWLFFTNVALNIGVVGLRLEVYWTMTSLYLSCRHGFVPTRFEKIINYWVQVLSSAA
ncbi:hypothetical protein EDD85DRAFT_955821 [Armillaria nabsnona]|nr:hypothetical protein EDD85DRAFT_955821 [Armillaria nabsnona]